MEFITFSLLKTSSLAPGLRCKFPLAETCPTLSNARKTRAQAILISIYGNLGRLQHGNAFFSYTEGFLQQFLHRPGPDLLTGARSSHGNLQRADYQLPEYINFG